MDKVRKPSKSGAYIPGNSFLVNISLSVNEGCGEVADVSQWGVWREVGGATNVDDRVTTNFNIFSASL
jgi:hypothetical protein